MKVISIFISALVFVSSCKKKGVADKIIIEGQISNIPDGKIYLTESHHWQIHLDSTICKNGHFIFKINTDSSFIPYTASIFFPDSSRPNKVNSILFRNHLLGADSTKHLGNAFYLEKGYIRIEGNNQENPYSRAFGGKENDIMLKNEFTSFGWPGNLDSAKRLKRIKFFKKEINKYPFSYYLLQNIYYAKEQYSEKELNGLLELFNADVQQSKLGKQFKNYAANRTDQDKPHSNLSLLSSTNQREAIIDTNSKLTMIVFWASWCGPCRMEIPLLKEVQNKYKGKGLKIISISIDENRDSWTKALNQEKMPWIQYIANKKEAELVKQKFNFSAIPLVVFTDNTGKEIERFAGYNEKYKENYENIIDKFIK